MTTTKTPPLDVEQRAQRGPLDRLPEVARVPDRADDRLRRLRRSAARHGLPTIMREGSVGRAAFAPVVSLGYLGMIIGGTLGGYAGDRIGRGLRCSAARCCSAPRRVSSRCARRLDSRRPAAACRHRPAAPCPTRGTGRDTSPCGSGPCGHADDRLCARWRDPGRLRGSPHFPRSHGEGCSSLAGQCRSSRRRYSLRHAGIAALPCEAPARWPELASAADADGPSCPPGRRLHTAAGSRDRPAPVTCDDFRTRTAVRHLCVVGGVLFLPAGRLSGLFLAALDPDRPGSARASPAPA